MAGHHPPSPLVSGLGVTSCLAFDYMKLPHHDALFWEARPKASQKGVHMPLTWIPGLYGPARDISQALARRRPPRLKQQIESTHLGGKTWIRVTAWCEGSKSVSVRGCFAELYVHAYDACVEPYPVRMRAIQFSPSGIVKLAPGEDPVHWEAQVANDQVRHISREHNAAETLKTYGTRGPKIQAELLEREQSQWAERDKFLWRLVRALGGPESVGIRAVIETTDGRSIATARVAVPPAPPIAERMSDAATVVRQATRSRSKVSEASSLTRAQDMERRS